MPGARDLGPGPLALAPSLVPRALGPGPGPWAPAPGAWIYFQRWYGKEPHPETQSDN